MQNFFLTPYEELKLNDDCFVGKTNHLKNRLKLYKILNKKGYGFLFEQIKKTKQNPYLKNKII